MKNTLERISAYSKMRAQAHSKSLDASHYIKFYTHEISHFNAEKGRKAEEQKLLGKLCAFQRTAKKHLSARAKSFINSVNSHLTGSFQALARP